MTVDSSLAPLRSLKLPLPDVPKNHPRSSCQAFLSMLTFLSQQRKVGKLLLVSGGTYLSYNTVPDVFLHFFL